MGDQLHPDGLIDRDVYNLIGSVYQEVERREPWCVDAHAVTDIAVLSLEKAVSSSWADAIPAATFGVVRMLEELSMQFDIVDTQADFMPYKLIILADEAVLDDATSA